MNNMIRRLRSAISLLAGDHNKEFTQTCDTLETEINRLANAQSMEEAELALQQVNGLWARAKDQHLRFTKRPMVKLMKPTK